MKDGYGWRTSRGSADSASSTAHAGVAYAARLHQLDRGRAHPLLSEPPEVVHLPSRIGTHRSPRTAVELLGMELEEPQPGSDTIVTSRLDTLLLHILRAVHADPSHPWTVEELGARGGLSRAAFARRFTALVGEPPLTYLTWWRLISASRLPRGDSVPLRLVAGRTGHTSEFAFAKAFKRKYGVTPGQYREQASWMY
jgi:AraC-like DNA-binding protein